MAYVDGFVAPVAPDKREAYLELARRSAKVFLEYGAIQVVETSKEARVAGWEKVMADERMKMADMPFDGKRMIHGGFDVMLNTAGDKA